MKCKDHPLFNLLSKPIVCDHNFNVRISEQFYLFNDTTACRKKKRAYSF